ncbi:TSUP family transporter, partial [Bacillus sp. JCM 19041]|uniref:TSUP family transporter n=1 Tax=Bacillus sp. JCM 19041 TaxID=1460637 RepID=UPI000A6F8545
MMSVLLLFVGFFAAAFGSLLGLGGGVIVVPSLLALDYIFSNAEQVSTQTAAGTSLAVMVVTGISSVIAYA